MSQYVCSFCRSGVHEPRHSISTCFACKATGIPWDRSKISVDIKPKLKTKKGKSMKKMAKAAMVVLVILCMATACGAAAEKQAEQIQPAQQAQQQPTLEQLNAQMIYFTGAKEVMTQQAKMASDAVGAYTVQIEQIKAKIETMQKQKQDAPKKK